MTKYSSLRKKLLLLLVPPLLILILIVSSILFRFAVVEQREAFDNALYDSAYSIYKNQMMLLPIYRCQKMKSNSY